MKPARTGTISGCIVWMIAFGVIGTCIFPVAALVGGLSSGSDPALSIVGPMVCPENTTPKIHTYATTTFDENGFERPATGYELQCLDINGKVVKTDPVVYSFIWIGIIAVIGFILTGILAFAFAAPAGMLITRLINRNKNNNQFINIEPE